MTRSLSLAASGFCAAALGCGSPAAPSSDALTLGRTINTAAFEYRFSASDSVDVAWQEAYHLWATAALGVSPARRIRYNKYLSRGHMGSQTGNSGTNAIANPAAFEIHTIWPRDNHEVVHLYSSLWGQPVALWSEGLAVAFQTDPVAGDLTPRWSAVAVHDRARILLSENRLIPVADLLTTGGFRSFDPDVTYPQAGSLMQFVLDTCGLAGVKRLYETGRAADTAAAVRTQFETACDRSVDDLENAWRAMLGGNRQDGNE